MDNRKRPMKSHGLEIEGNRGLLWAEDHTGPGVVPPPTLERSFASLAEVPHAYGPSGVRFSVCSGWSGSHQILIFAMDNR